MFLAACSKEMQPEHRKGGVVPDDEKKAARVPLLISKKFVNDSVVAKGKPSTNIYFLYPADQSTVTGTVSIKTSVASTIYIDGIQVSQNGMYSWNTENANKGYHTITAQVKGTKVSITVFIETVIINPPASSAVILWTPPVSNQGGEASCVAFAVGYSARSIEWFYNNKVQERFSPEHLFNQIKFGETCDVGTAMQTALDFIMLNGICRYQSMQYSSTNGCDSLPNEQQKQEALQYKIDGYYKMYPSDQAAIKAMIDQNHPVIISIVVDNEFMNAKPGFIWDRYSGNGSLGHSVLICGYDDNRKAYYIMNSWGTSWADGGFSWITYELFPTRTGTWCYAIK
jgi:hypothetical protein